MTTQTNTGAGPDWADIVKSYPCPTCGAAPGDPCQTYAGAIKGEPHAPRSAAARTNDWHYPETSAT